MNSVSALTLTLISIQCFQSQKILMLKLNAMYLLKKNYHCIQMSVKIYEDLKFLKLCILFLDYKERPFH